VKSNAPLYRAIARAFLAEGVDRHFTLMGDANMHVATALAQDCGVRTIHARHEHCAVAMASGYARASGKVGLASTTCGPGFTQIATALTTAVRGEVPLVVFAGDTPAGNAWNYMDFDQATLTRSTGAHFIGVRSVNAALDQVREAFHSARHERRPTVISIPFDVQMMREPDVSRYSPSTELLPNLPPIPPDQAMVDRVAALIAGSERPVIIAGRGALRAAEALKALGAASGALLATTMYANGLFVGDPYDIGCAGGWGSLVSADLFAQSDLVLAVGASLSAHTRHGGKLFPNAVVIQIDNRPQGLHQGARVADMTLVADAAAAAWALEQRLRRPETLGDLPAQALSPDYRRTGFRTPAVRDQIALGREDDFDYPLEPGTVDPRQAIAELNRVIPKDWYMVLGSGHSAFFTFTGMTGRPVGYLQSTRDFGAIGSNLATAIGAAEARGNDGELILVDGDGSLLMHIQELETVVRHGIRMLIVVLNDGAYGAEVHKLRADGLDPSEVVFGRADFAAIGQGFGLRGTTVTRLGQFQELFDRHVSNGRPEIWNVHTSGNVVSRFVRARK
jgi:acetolactate synthase I/II/III large subunit